MPPLVRLWGPPGLLTGASGAVQQGGWCSSSRIAVEGLWHISSERRGSHVTRRAFTAAEGADSHCQLGNLPLSNALVCLWLDEVLT